MKHHFADFLPRDQDYWTIVPNLNRHAYRIHEVPAGSNEVTIVTIGKEDEHWARVLTLPNLEELTLHEPTQEQMLAVSDLRSIKRLRVTHARPKSIDFIASMEAVEELVLEYVSGFGDLSPLARLKNLRSLHMENLRKVTDFGGLAGVRNLRYLAIYGTLDWQQPIQDFEFLRGLPGLEVFAMFQVVCRAQYPATLPMLALRKLKTLRVHCSYLAAEECALLEEGLPAATGAHWGPYQKVAQSYLKLQPDDVRARMPAEELASRHPEVIVRYDGEREIPDPANEWFEFTGRAAGRVKCTSAHAEAKCHAYAEGYAAMKMRARELIDAPLRNETL
jgi:hypothetical protein